MIRKIQLVSNSLSYGASPMPEDEVEQHITLLSDGRVWLSRYRYGSGFKYEIKDKEAFRIHTATAVQIIQATEECFCNYTPILIPDTGTWKLSLTNKNGEIREINGSLCKDDRIEKYHLSKRIRTAFDRENLFLFDGKPTKKPDELIFCNARFDYSAKTYCYLADTDDYEEGDQVVVQVGEGKREAIVEIESIQYLPAEKAPYPLDRIKHIVRKYEKKNPINVFKELERTAYAPFSMPKPTVTDWKKAYLALKELVGIKPDEGSYPNTLGQICYYGRHTDGVPQFEEARKWYELGTKLNVIESMYELADMLLDGLGGDKDIKRAISYYNKLYWYSRDQFEAGKVMSSFADVAMRVGLLFHNGTGVEKDDEVALNYLLEARYAIEKRKPFHQYGDDNVEKRIEEAIESCEKAPEELRKQELIGMGLGRVPEYFLRNDQLMSFRLAISEDKILRLRFVRKNIDQPDVAWGAPVIWAVSPTLECFSTCFITVYGKNVRMTCNLKPGKEVLCDRYEYDKESGLHQFFHKDERTCWLMGGEYYLYMTDLRLAIGERPPTKFDSFKKELYEIAKRNQEEHKGEIVENICPVCGEKKLHASIEGNYVSAACIGCCTMLDFTWPEKEKTIPFDRQRTWKDI